MSEPNSKIRPSKPRLLNKANSWSPDSEREAAWLNRRRDFRRMQNCGCRFKSFSDYDVDDLRACFELGFFGCDFDPPVLDPRLASTLPALELYHAVNQKFTSNLSRSSSTVSSGSSTTMTTSSPPRSDAGNPSNLLFEPGDDPQVKKMRLKQWAKVVACKVEQTVRQPKRFYPS